MDHQIDLFRLHRHYDYPRPTCLRSYMYSLPLLLHPYLPICPYRYNKSQIDGGRTRGENFGYFTPPTYCLLVPGRKYHVPQLAVQFHSRKYPTVSLVSKLVIFIEIKNHHICPQICWHLNHTNCSSYLRHWESHLHHLQSQVISFISF